MFGVEHRLVQTCTDGGIHRIRKFSHISRPFVGHEDLHEFRGNPLEWSTIPLAALSETVHRQVLDVFLAFPQRRQFYGESLHSKKKVRSELSFSHHLVQPPVCGGYKSEVTPFFSFCAYGTKSPLLKDPQEGLLYYQRQLSYLIKKECSPVRLLNEAFPCAVGTSESPSFMTKKHAFHQVFRYGCTVYYHKTLGSPLTVGMYSPGEQFFACSGLACQEHADIAACCLSRKAQAPFELRAAPHQTIQLQDSLRSLLKVLFFSVLKCPGQNHLHGAQGTWFLEKIPNTILHGQFCSIRVPVGRYNNHLRGRWLFVHMGKHI
ncbi:MAG: hypothetical protein A4E58_01940 [Syntrophorhabdus sp. PtaB.Bin006]|nr:MAG: hypothetical protein A4E58_01940 [Syntrophorhabdus sp. PtaB.Bin006]